MSKINNIQLNNTDSLVVKKAGSIISVTDPTGKIIWSNYLLGTTVSFLKLLNSDSEIIVCGDFSDGIVYQDSKTNTGLKKHNFNSIFILRINAKDGSIISLDEIKSDKSTIQFLSASMNSCGNLSLLGKRATKNASVLFNSNILNSSSDVFSIRIPILNECSSVNCKSILGNDTTITNQIWGHVFPNPTDGKLFINSQSDISDKIIIKNLLGESVMEFNSNSIKNNEIDISNLIDGIYFLNLIINNTTHVEKIILNR